MKQTLLLLVLALGMFCINMDAQTKKQSATKRTTMRRSTNSQQGGQIMKFRQVGEDGYVWYKMKKVNLCGVRDSEGNNIIPIKYSFVDYRVSEYTGTHFFYVADGEYKGAYTREGTCVIPTNLHYTGIGLEGTSNWICWNVTKNGSQGILDGRGKEVIPPIYDSVVPQQIFVNGGERSNDWLFLVEKNNMFGLFDLDGNIICPIQYHFISYVRNSNGSFEMNCKETEINESRFVSICYSSKTKFDYHSYENLYYAFNKQSSSSSMASSNTTNTTSSSASSGNSNNTSSTGGTQTIVVEHHRDPVPVQEWHACIGCGGMGTMGCDNCGGSGTKYIGDRLHRCSRCNGQGIIPCNICYGSKGKYITVYR